MIREEAIRKLQKQKAEYLEEWVDFSGVAEAYDMAIEALEQPIIDAVQVVRCKDCKHYKQSDVADRKMCCRKDVDGFFVCYEFEPDDFCSYGERE